MRRIPILFKLYLLTIFISSGCSLPYIDSHRDALTPEDHFRLAQAYEKNKEYEAAVREYKAASAQIGEAHYFLGNIYFTQRDYQNAEKHYKITLKILPQDPRAYNNLAWLYFMERKNLKRAESLALRGLQLAPKDNIAPYLNTLDRIRAEQEK